MGRRLRMGLDYRIVDVLQDLTIRNANVVIFEGLGSTHEVSESQDFGIDGESQSVVDGGTQPGESGDLAWPPPGDGGLSIKEGRWLNRIGRNEPSLPISKEGYGVEVPEGFSSAAFGQRLLAHPGFRS